MLTDNKIRQLKTRDSVYRVADSHGLNLEIRPSGSKHWRYRYRFGGKGQMYSIGAYPSISLSEARQQRDRLKALVKDGIHPSEHKRAEKAAQRTERANTFKAVSNAWMAENEAQWSARYHTQVKEAFKRHLYPELGDLPVSRVTAPLLRDSVTEAGKTAPTVAILLLQWVSGVYRYAVLHDLAEYDPAPALKGLVKRPKVRHHPALKAKEIPTLLKKLDEYQGYPTTKAAINLMLLTFVRTSELRLAEWSEFDLEAAQWRVPAQRMKMGEEHIVPLSSQAVDLLRELHRASGNRQYLFPNTRNPRTCMTVTTINRALERMGYQGKFSGHGFRSTASTLLNEMGYRPDLIERQLAHAERNKVRAAYNQAQYLEERAGMMQGWADYIDGLKGGNVVAGKFSAA